MDAPPIAIPRRDPASARRWVIVGIVAVFAGLVVLFWFNPSQYHFYPLCMLYVTTGLYCPGCGCLRAMHQLAHGHLWMAFRYNPLFIVSLPLLVWLAYRHIPRWIDGQRSGELKPLWLAIIVGIILAFSIMRNIPMAPFNLLAPPG